MKKTTDSLKAGLENCTKETLQTLFQTICKGNKNTANFTKIVLGIDVDNAIQSIRSNYNEFLGNTGFSLGKDCYYDYDDIDEVESHLKNLFKSVMGPLIDYKKYSIVTVFFKELFLIASSMYGPGGDCIAGSLFDLLKEYWFKIIEAQGYDDTYKKEIQAWFKTPEIYEHLESYGLEDFFDEVINFKQKTPAPVSTKLSYIKMFMYLKPTESVPEKREILVIAENDFYVQGIDFKYLTAEQIEECRTELNGNSKVQDYVYTNSIPSWIEEDYDYFTGACRIFKKDRIVREL